MVRTPLPDNKAILITGCSSGIGWATADRLARAGHLVCATARRAESVAELAEWAKGYAGRASAARLDVTDATTVDEAVEAFMAKCGRLDVLINNAGYGQVGAIEDVRPELWRRQFETNLIGVLVATQAALPHMRAAGRGRIVNVSSVVAHLAVPMMGAYCASKHALEAASNALRVEVASFGIDVVLIEPGPIATRFRPNLDAVLKENPVHEQSAYGALYASLEGYHAQSSQDESHSADDVARSIERAVNAKRPRTRYRITGIAKWFPRLLPFVSDRMFDRFAQWQLRALRRQR